MTLRIIRKTSGFTIIEVMVTLLVAAVIVGGVYAAYSTQQKSYVASDQIAEMQQNLRAALLVMTREIREAGCDPTGSANAGFSVADVGRVRFTRDIAGHTVNPNQSDGDAVDTNENITFGFVGSDDINSNGIVDGGGADWSEVADLQRMAGSGSTYQPIAERMAALEFNYILEDDTTTTAPTTSQLKKIRAVQISLLTVARAPDSELVNTTSYTTASGATWGPFNDKYRRRFVTTTIQCRNMGL